MAAQSAGMTATRRLFRQLLWLCCLGVATIQVYQFAQPERIAWRQLRVPTIAIDPRGEIAKDAQ